MDGTNSAAKEIKTTQLENHGLTEKLKEQTTKFNSGDLFCTADKKIHFLKLIQQTKVMKYTL